MGLNFRDVLNVLGEYPGDPGPPGGDCAGVVLQVDAGTGAAHLRTGEAALGISVASLASVARGPAAWLAPKPAALSFEAACTLPITWSTVHAALGGAQLRRGQAMLIHAAAGGVGLVAVEYAHWLGSVVHATAGRPYKHQLVSHLGAVLGDLRAISLSSSRDGAAFARGAACALRSGRLAAVLNSLSADFISASAALLGEGGAFEEIGKRGVWSAARMQHSRAAARYEVLAIDDDMHQDPPWMQRVLQRLSQRAAAGVLHGLPTQTFDLAREWEAAFRLLQSGRNIGKVVVRVASTERDPRPAAVGVQLLTGGTGGLGLLTARWLARRGAPAVVLASRGGVLARGAASEWAQLRASGAAVHLARCDVADASEVRRLLAALAADVSSADARLRGVWHAAGVLADGLLRAQTASALRRVYAPRRTALGALQRGVRRAAARRRACSSRRWRRCWAAAARPTTRRRTAASTRWRAGGGGAGQAATSVQWGPWAEVGMAAGGGVNARLQASGSG